VSGLVRCRVAILAWLGCAACVGSKTPAASDAGPPADALADDMSTVAETSSTTDAVAKDTASEATVPDGDSGEYCPDPAYPPRTDGCPCFPPGGGCSAADLGKTCDYLQMCPGGAIGGSSGDRAHCEWVTPVEGPTVRMWVRSPAPCPSDAGPG